MWINKYLLIRPNKPSNQDFGTQRGLKLGFRDSKRLSCGTSQNTLHLNTNK